MKTTLAAVLATPLIISAATIHLAGDSTMARYSQKRSPLTGWGMELKALCQDNVNVNNRAVSGASSRSFREKFWGKLIAKVQPGDFVFIQFGHNDRSKKNDRYADPDTTFQDNLRFFINEVRAKKATPILLTPTPICRFNKKGKMFNAKLLQKYIDATIKVAAEEKVELINLNVLMLAEFGPLGAENASQLYMNLAPGKYTAYPDGRKDNTHLQKKGAKIAARLVVEDAKEQKLEVAKLFK